MLSREGINMLVAPTPISSGDPIGTYTFSAWEVLG